MKDLIRNLEQRTVKTVFGGIYITALAFALVPVLYLWGSGVDTTIFGIPFSVLYWIANGLVLGFGLWGLYIVEDIRGELDESVAPAESSVKGQ